jgi:hypothetical protein
MQTEPDTEIVSEETARRKTWIQPKLMRIDAGSAEARVGIKDDEVDKS